MPVQPRRGSGTWRRPPLLVEQVERMGGASSDAEHGQARSAGETGRTADQQHAAVAGGRSRPGDSGRRSRLSLRGGPVMERPGLRRVAGVRLTGLSVTLRALVIGVVVMLLFFAGFWAMLRLAGGPEGAAGAGAAPTPAEEEGAPSDPAIPDTTDEAGGGAVEGNPGQDPSR